MQKVYKFLTTAEWETFKHESVYYGSIFDRADGFIHCSEEHQLDRIRDKFFKNQSPLILITIECEKLSNGMLLREANRPGGDEYPHIYGPLPIEAVSSAKLLE